MPRKHPNCERSALFRPGADHLIVHSLPGACAQGARSRSGLQKGPGDAHVTARTPRPARQVQTGTRATRGAYREPGPSLGPGHARAQGSARPRLGRNSEMVPLKRRTRQDCPGSAGPSSDYAPHPPRQKGVLLMPLPAHRTLTHWAGPRLPTKFPKPPLWDGAVSLPSCPRTTSRPLGPQDRAAPGASG